MSNKLQRRVLLMELVTLLIRIPTIITCIMAATNFFVLLSNKISIETFYKIRKTLCIIRWIANLIATIGIVYLKEYDIAMLIAIIMLFCAITDIIFLFFIKKLISKR